MKRYLIRTTRLAGVTLAIVGLLGALGASATAMPSPVVVALPTATGSLLESPDPSAEVELADPAAAPAGRPDFQREPTAWNMFCRDGSGLTYYVSNPGDCTRGYVKLISTRTDKVEGGMDIYGAEFLTSQTLEQLYNSCESSFWCDFFVIGALQTFVLSKVRPVWLAIRGRAATASLTPGTVPQS
ncbi:MAG: hypothetical protein ACRCSN_06160 [Dermatophilaceae bacterium]